MLTIKDQPLLDTLLDSWDRNNTIVVNLLRALPEGALETRTSDGGPSLAQLFTHMHYVRLVSVFENAPYFGGDPPETEWLHECDTASLVQKLNESAKLVREAVQCSVATGQSMRELYDHPILMLQHLIWHEGYHHGQIKLALKAAGQPLANRDVGRGTWGVWMRKTHTQPQA